MSQILTSKTAKIKSQELRTKLPVFTNTLSAVGVFLSFSEEPHILSQEQALVVRDLDKCLGNSPDNIEEFIRGLKTLCEKEKYFKKALLPSWFRRNNDDQEIGANLKIQQESLFR